MANIIDAERAPSATCPECGRTLGHERNCALSPLPRYEDYLRELRASRPEDYWAKYVSYLTD